MPKKKTKTVAVIAGYEYEERKTEHGVEVILIPIIECHRVKGKNTLTFICPFCGERHNHGASGIDAKFGAGNGHRVKHCAIDTTDNKHGYILQEVKE